MIRPMDLDLFPFGLVAGVILAWSALSRRDRPWRTR